MDIEDAGCHVKYLIRDRDGRYPPLFDAVLADAGITVVLSGVQLPRMNAVVERWVRTCRRELLDRTLIWNQRHLMHPLREYEARAKKQTAAAVRTVLGRQPKTARVLRDGAEAEVPV